MSRLKTIALALSITVLSACGTQPTAVCRFPTPPASLMVKQATLSSQTLQHSTTASPNTPASSK